MSEYLQKIVYLSDSQYQQLAQGTSESPVTIGGLTNLNDNYIYMTDGKVSLNDFDASFVLPVSKGGTGASSWSSGKILVGNGSDTFTTIDKATANTGSTLVQRDENGDFSARNITMTQGNIGSMTLSGTSIATVTSISTTGSNGLLAYKPANWTGVTSSQWGVGTVDIQGVIRSSNSDLLHSRNGTNSVIFDTDNYKTYAYALDGSNTGTKLCLATQSAAYTNGIQFMNSTTKKGSVGCDNTGTMCMYGASKIALRPILDAATDGVEITTSAITPTKNNTMALGGTSNKWTTVYAATFNGALNGKVSVTHTANDSKEINITYSSTIDYWWGVGKANSNHGLYDEKASGGAKWILSADTTSHVWTFVGNVTGNVSGTATNVTGTVAIANGGTGLSSADPHQVLIGPSSGSTAAAPTWRIIVAEDLPSASTTAAGIIQIGTDANNAMAGNTNVNNVAISANVTTNANYPIVFATSNKDTTAAKNEGLQKSGAKLYFNPSSGTVYATSFYGSGEDLTSLTPTNITGVVTTTAKKFLKDTGAWTQVDWGDLTGKPSTFAPIIGSTDTTAMAGNTIVTNVAISANVTTNANYPVVFATSNKDTTAAKNEGVQKSGAKFYFNPNSGILTATGFAGALTGNVTGNCSGSAGTVAHTLATTTKYYMSGTTLNASGNSAAMFDTNIYTTATAGYFSAVMHSFNVSGVEKAYIAFNSTDNSLDFIFL